MTPWDFWKELLVVRTELLRQLQTAPTATIERDGIAVTVTAEPGLLRWSVAERGTGLELARGTAHLAFSACTDAALALLRARGLQDAD